MKKLDVETLLKKLTIEEKCSLLVGDTKMFSKAIERLDIPRLVFSDGTNGIRKEEYLTKSMLPQLAKTTCFPSGSTVANSFNKELMYKYGKAIAKECVYFDLDVLLGPAVNIKRNPRCGRNFEYYSEDPLLAGYLAASFINGVQSENIGTCIKHYALNNNEKYRYVGDSVCDPRTMHEIYLKPFEISIRESNPYSIMSSYNKVNGLYASENPPLLNKILREEFKFQGLCVTDWGGGNFRDKGLLAGTDLEMPGGSMHSVNEIIEAYSRGEISEELIDKSVKNLLLALNKTHFSEKTPQNSTIFEENYALSVQMAKDSIVLLKNEGTLPLNTNPKYLVVGEMFKNIRYQGNGSALINPYKLSSFEESFNNRKVNYVYIKGYDLESNKLSKKLNDELAEQAKLSDQILLFLGLPDSYESEGFDRDDIKLPSSQIELLDIIKSLNMKVTVILSGGSSIEAKCLDFADAILYLGLSGQGIGEATTSILFGEVSPSGRLAETWYESYEDVPYGQLFNSVETHYYKESVYVGYRYLTTSNKKAKYPFGHGLSYSKFEYNNFVVEEKENYLQIDLDIKNNSEFDGSEVVQIYVFKKDSSIFRPKVELKGFEKEFIKKHETKHISLKINKEDLKVFDTNKGEFVLENGTYSFIVAKNAEEYLLSKEISIKGDVIETKYSKELAETYLCAKNICNVSDELFEELYGEKLPEALVFDRPYNENTPIYAYKTFFGKLIRWILMTYSKLSMGKKPKEEGSEQYKKQVSFLGKMIASNCLRSIYLGSSGALTYNAMKGLVELVNNHPIRTMKYFFKKEEELLKTKNS